MNYKDGDVLVLVIPDTSHYKRRVLEYLGAKVIEVDPQALTPEAARKIIYDIYKDQFGKLYLWNMTSYDQILFIDSDMFLKRDIRPIWSLKGIDDYNFAAVKDINLGTRFNAGLFMLKTSVKRLEDMLQYIYKNTDEWKGNFAEQDFLNWYWGKSFYILPDEYNIQFNLAFTGQRSAEILEQGRILHFTGPSKVWKEYMNDNSVALKWKK